MADAASSYSKENGALSDGRLVAKETGGWLIEGPINYHTVVRLRAEGERRLQEAGSSCSFDFSGVSQVNTSALSLLLCWRREARRLNVEIRYEAVPPELMAIAEMSDLQSLFTSN